VTSDRLLVIAPHPDDEVIGAGGLIQRAAAHGDVRVVFVTAGENNPWPQRVLQRKWLITAEDRIAWGALRRREAMESLAALGAPEHAPIFLNFPDTQIARMARGGDQRLSEILRTIIREFQPSLLVSTSAQDFHADHRAVAYFAHHAVRGTGDNAPEIVTYVVHGDGAPHRLHFSLQLTDRECERKRKAIECHASQLLLGRRRFLSYAQPREDFFAPEFDLVCTESRAKERAGKIRHACFVLFGGRAHQPARAPFGIDRSGTANAGSKPSA
jgi:LmbE family N-acetylglucosaminyl deacetylase